MFETLLLIRRDEGFIVSTVRRNLEQRAYTVLESGYDRDEIAKVKDLAAVIIVYADEDLDDVSAALLYLKEVCVDENRQIIVLGNPYEFEAVSRLVSSENIAELIERPINVESLVAAITTILDEQSMQQRKRCILVVDDDTTYLRTIRGWLKDRYRVGMANSGMQALTWLAGNTPDLILLDYDMPVTNGPQVMKMLHGEPGSSDIPVMFLTGKSDKQSIMEVLSLKPAGYLLKTIDRNSLLETLDNFFLDQMMKHSE
ncbi:MAG: response regulator [Lachnospiraceae bacterium]|nr:response regulator [Lachnospiraceae bacterium]